MAMKTADLYDKHPHVFVGEPLLTSYGSIHAFNGQIVTVKVYEDNVLVRQTLEKPGDGQVLVVDGAGSLRTALLGDQLASLAISNEWAGIIIYGCIRDAAEIASLPIGIKALNTTPRKSYKRGTGETDIVVSFAGVVFVPGHYVYADTDGIIVSYKKYDATTLEEVS